MSTSIHSISLTQLLIAALPAAAVVFILFRWQLRPGQALYALLRMLIQLLLIGYLLASIFSTDSVWVVLLVLLVMISFSSWIALGVVPPLRLTLLTHAIAAIAVPGSLILAVVSQSVLSVQPWYQASIVIPIAGMIYANAMNSVSLAAERVVSEFRQHGDWQRAQKTAMQTAMIPVINGMLAVGLVSLPGMMTGQILAGVSPLLAVRYQIVVMCMIFASSGLSCYVFLSTISRPMQSIQRLTK